MTIAREELKDMDFGDVATGRRLAAVHPGTVLMEDFITSMSLTRYRVAKQSGGVQQRRIDEICAGDRGIMADNRPGPSAKGCFQPMLWPQATPSADSFLSVLPQLIGTAVLLSLP